MVTDDNRASNLVRPIPAPLADDIAEHITDRISRLSDDDTLIITLWIFYTWFYELCRAIPYFHGAALDKDSAKTELAYILNDLCYGAQLVSPTIASMSVFRNTGGHTLIIDEIQGLLKARSTDQDSFYRLVNHGYKPGVPWQVSDIMRPGSVENRETFFPKAFIGLDPGILRDTAASRCIQVLMRAGDSSDQDERERRQALRPVRETAERLAGKLANLAGNTKVREIFAERISDHARCRTLNDGSRLYNRNDEVWRPLIVCADMISEDCGKRIRDIAAAYVNSEPEHIPTMDEAIDADLLKVMRERRLTIVAWTNGKQPVFHGSNFMLTNNDFGYPAPRGPVKNRLPQGSVIISPETSSAELRFKAREFTEICQGIGWPAHDVKRAYEQANRLHAQEGRTSIVLPFIQGQPKISVVAIDISRWLWPDAPVGNLMEKSVARILASETGEDMWNADN